MKTKKILIASVLAVALLGCGKREPRHIVILVDVSGSIERQSLEQAFKAIDELAGHLQRGDRLTIIPILGDAEAEVSGRILRFEVLANRQAYDIDLRRLRIQLIASLNAMLADAINHPGAKTDILGSVAFADQELQSDKDKADCLLLVLSDFIQEDSRLDFRTDNHLENSANTRELAVRLLTIRPVDLKNTRVYLGLLRSVEYIRMEKSRRSALQSFWVQYFNACGAHLIFASDGPGLINRAMSNF